MGENGSSGVIVCRVGPDRFALPVSAVREVVATPPLAKLPGASAAVRGVANVRGALVTAVSGSVLLGHGAPAPTEWLVVLTLRDGLVGLEVDEVEDLQSEGSHGLRVLDAEALIRPLLALETADD